MKFQYISDLHLEFGTRIQLIPVAENLIVAGDICHVTSDKYYLFIEEMSKKFKKVFIITGNHEYYGTSIQGGEIILKNNIKEYSNVYYLQNSSYHFEDCNISIFGSTYWSEINKENEKTIKRCINDFKYIQKFNIKDFNRLHKEAKRILEEEINTKPDRQWILILHHVPQIYLTDKQYLKTEEDRKINEAFSSNNEFIEKTENIKYVVYGHTHSKSHHGKYLCNPYGYPGENDSCDIIASFELI